MSDSLPTPLTQLTEDEIMFRDAVRDFANEEIKPHVSAMDQSGEYVPGLLEKFAELGLLGIDVPEEYGGAGGSFFMSILAVEEISAVDAAAAILTDVQNTLVNAPIIEWGSDDLKKRYLPKLAEGAPGAYALTEAGSGSDAFALKLRADKDGDDYVLNGTKLWITNGAVAEVFIIFANVDFDAGYRGITAFVVDRDTPGFTVGKKEDKLGIRASSTVELILENVRVPAANVIGEVGKGYKVAMQTLNGGRIGIGAQMIGVARGALDAAIQYTKERKQFGKPIGEFQAIQFQIAQAATDLEAARLLTYNAARMHDAGVEYTREAAMCKLLSSQMAERVTSLCVEIFGGYGYTKEYPVEKFWRDAKIGSIYEGTSNMQLATIAKLVMSD